MKLSILIPCIPERLDKLKYLYDKLLKQIGDRDVEVIAVVDNKKRTIGEKRNNVKALAKGDYFMMLDDDDDINIHFIDSVLEAIEKDVDCITYKQRCKNIDGSDFLVTFGLGNEIETLTENGRYLDCKRPAWHCCVWKTEVFQKIQFPHVNYGEDMYFQENANSMARSNHHIDKVLHFYNFDLDKSAATTEDNEQWKNPN